MTNLGMYSELSSWSDLSTLTRWPILLALACTMYAASWLAHFHCRRVAMCLQRAKRQAAQDRQDAEPT